MKKTTIENESLLLIDAGNSRVKWAWWDGKLGLQHSAGWAKVNSDDFFSAGRTADRIVVANVGGRRIHELINGKGVEVVFVETGKEAGGVTNAYREPTQMGVDRWVAMIGARQHRSGPLVVVDAGTALTVDMLENNGKHLGGVIAPGYRMMLSSLLGNTSDIAGLTEAAADTIGIEEGIAARSTSEAIHSGSLIALVSLIRHGQEFLERRTQVSPRILLCGGDADMLLPLLHNAEIVGDLVLRGLVIIAGKRP
ncbi:MAG: type III pantothenate kinase [Gammaproteobacteria bacterium]|nr:type III pantothenate kinase [Gammaproteobacteria bacterium]